MLHVPYDIKVLGANNLKPIKNSTILIYWPHGVGDWVFLGYIAKFLEPSNTYFVTRYGDDNVSIFDNHEIITPLYTGYNGLDHFDGKIFGQQHYGIKNHNGSVESLMIPASLYKDIIKHKIEYIYYCGFPDSWGNYKYPFHTKARHGLTYMCNDIEPAILRHPLTNTINFANNEFTTQYLDSILENKIGAIHKKKICLINRTGFTGSGKNWGHAFRNQMPPKKNVEGEEARDFIKLMKSKNPDWIFISMENCELSYPHTIKSLDDNCYSYHEIFSKTTIPFGFIIKHLIRRADLMIGVPSGPYELAMIYNNLPTIGIWIEQLPSWYDEPKSLCVNLISKNVYGLEMDKRSASFFERDNLKYNHILSDTNIISAELVMSAVEKFY